MKSFAVIVSYDQLFYCLLFLLNRFIKKAPYKFIFRLSQQLVGLVTLN